MNIHNLNEIEALARIMEQTGLTGLQLAQGDVALRLERSHTAPSPRGELSPAPVPPLPQQPQAAAPARPQPPQEQPDSAVSPQPVAAAREIPSPMVGIFYAAPSPDAQPFVEVGRRVKAGDVLCIIEAMKLMNEITAEHDGQILEICVSNGQVVEFGQPLFRMA